MLIFLYLKQTRQKKLGHHLSVSDSQSLIAATRAEQMYMLPSRIPTWLLLPCHTTSNMGRECCGLNGAYIPISVLSYNKLFPMRCTWNLLRHWALFIDQTILKVVQNFFLERDISLRLWVITCISLHLFWVWVWGFWHGEVGSERKKKADLVI